MVGSRERLLYYNQRQAFVCCSKKRSISSEQEAGIPIHNHNPLRIYDFDTIFMRIVFMDVCSQLPCYRRAMAHWQSWMAARSRKFRTAVTRFSSKKRYRLQTRSELDENMQCSVRRRRLKTVSNTRTTEVFPICYGRRASQAGTESHC